MFWPTRIVGLNMWVSISVVCLSLFRSSIYIFWEPRFDRPNSGQTSSCINIISNLWLFEKFFFTTIREISATKTGYNVYVDACHSYVLGTTFQSAQAWPNFFTYNYYFKPMAVWEILLHNRPGHIRHQDWL